MQKILIIGHNYYPELTGIGKYTAEFGTYMANKNGFDVEVITGKPHYPQWKVFDGHKNRFFSTEIVKGVKLHRVPMFIPKTPNGFKRLIMDALFIFNAWLVLNYLLIRGKKYDMVFTPVPSFALGLLSLYYRLFVRQSKLVYHVQDLQIDMAKEMNMIKSPALLSLLEKIEKFIIKRVDFVSTISPGMASKIKEKVNREVINFPNWANITHFFPIKNKEALKQEWGFDAQDKIVLYSGNIGEKQGLEQILNIAEMFKPKPNVKFIICGSGAYKAVLLKSAKAKELENVIFLPLQATDVFNNFLNLADLHLILQKKDASDLVLPSKLTTILAVGGLVVATANKGTSLYNEINDNEIGILAQPEDDIQLFDAINEGLAQSHTQLKFNARQYAEQNISQEGIMQRFMKTVDLEVSEIPLPEVLGALV